MQARTPGIILLLFAAVAFVHAGLNAQVASFPYRESFDGVTAPVLPDGWTSSQNRTPGVSDFTTTTSTPRSTPNAVLSTNATIEQYLVSPRIDFLSTFPDSLSFFVRRSSSHQARVVVEASLDDGVSYATLIGDTLRALATTSYAGYSFPLPGELAASSSVRLRWRVIPDASGSTGTFRIDDLCISVRTIHDLALDTVRFLPLHPVDGDSIVACFTVRNVGLQPSGAFSVEAYLDRNADSVAQMSELIASMTASGPVGVSDTQQVRLGLGRLRAGEELLIGRVVYGPDQNPVNNNLPVPLVIGFQRGSLVINEIMYAPASPEPEWVELYNTKPDSVSIRNWLVSDNIMTSRRLITAGDIHIPPGGYLLLTADSGTLAAQYPALSMTIIHVTGFPSLNNTGDAVVLYGPGGTVVDSLVYMPEWGGNDGSSLERVDPLGTSCEPLNWGSCTDPLHATPSAANSIVLLDFDLKIIRFREVVSSPGTDALLAVTVRNNGRMMSGSFSLAVFDDADRDSTARPEERVAEVTVDQPVATRDSLQVMATWQAPAPGLHALVAVIVYPADLRRSNDTAFSELRVGYNEGTVVINEIMAEPFSGNAEYVELLNTSGSDVDLSEWVIHDLAGSTSGDHVPLSRDTRIVHRGEYVVVASDTTLYTSFPRLAQADQRLVVIAGRDLGLNNDQDAVVLDDLSGLMVDSVSYLRSWHNPGVTDPAGRSLERISPLLGSNDARNWSSCAYPSGGTPGETNSIYTKSPSSSATLNASPNPFSPDDDGWEDFTVIRFQLSLPISMVRVRIFDVRGRLIRTLMNNEPAGPAGEVIWDGRDDDRGKARIGVYVVLLEAVDERGGVVVTAKGTVVVAARL